MQSACEDQTHDVAWAWLLLGSLGPEGRCSVQHVAIERVPLAQCQNEKAALEAARKGHHAPKAAGRTIDDSDAGVKATHRDLVK